MSSASDVKSQFHWIDHSVLALVLLLSAAVGAFFGFRVRSVADYLTGSRKMRTLPIAISLIARCTRNATSRRAWH